MGFRFPEDTGLGSTGGTRLHAIAALDLGHAHRRLRDTREEPCERLGIRLVAALILVAQERPPSGRDGRISILSPPRILRTGTATYPEGREYRKARPAPGTPEDGQLFALASVVERYGAQHVVDLPEGDGR
ncbi:protein of unknown function [Paraburkholderia kururiensis]